MKRYGNIIEEIVQPENLDNAFYYVLRGARGRTRTGRWMIAHKDEVLDSIRKDIEAGTFKPHGYIQFPLREGGKIRLIQSVSKSDRIALNAIMSVVEKYCNPSFIADSASSIKGRGCKYLSERMVEDMKRDPAGTRFVYKLDVRKYYDSIDQDKAMRVFKRKFKDARLIAILDSCVRMMSRGISIGLRSSQVIGNLYLDYYLDHVMKDELGAKYYRRYCDDIVIQAGSYNELTRLARIVHEQMDKAGLQIKSNEQMWDTQKRPIDFLGWIHYADYHKRIRKRTKKRFVRCWNRVKSKKRKVALIGSFYGLTKHADARHLFKKTTGMTMKDFKEFGFRYERKDGKKIFDCPLVSLTELNKETIVVLDYETDIHTQHGERTLVLFEHPEKGKGKFVTKSEEMLSALDYIKAQDGFPFRTTITRVEIGHGKWKYTFN